MTQTLIALFLSSFGFAHASTSDLILEAEKELAACCNPAVQPCTREQAFCATRISNRVARAGEQALLYFVGALAESARPAIESACRDKEGAARWACAREHIRANPMLEKRQQFAERSFQEFLEWATAAQRTQENCAQAVESFVKNPPKISDAVERHMEAKKKNPACPPPLRVAKDWDKIPALEESELQKILNPPPPVPRPVAKAAAQKARPWKKPEVVAERVPPRPKPVPSPRGTPSPSPKAKPRILTIDQTEPTDRQLRAWQAREARHFEFARDSLAKLEQLLAKGQGKEKKDGLVVFEDDTQVRFLLKETEGSVLARAAYLLDRWLELDVVPAVVPARLKDQAGYWVVQLPGVQAPGAADAPSERMKVLDYLLGHPERLVESWGVVGKARRPVMLSARAGFQELAATPVQDVAKVIAGNARLMSLYEQAKDEVLLNDLADLLSASQLEWLKKRLEQLRDRVKILSNFTRSS